MFDYNKILQRIHDIDIDVDDDGDNSKYNDEILMNHTSNSRLCITDSLDDSLLDNIIQHSFIENISLDLDSIRHYREKIYIIPYKISTLNEHHFVEYNIDVAFPSIALMNIDHVSENVIDTLDTIYGMKKIVGNVVFKNNCYVFVQVRNNNGCDEKWITTWDIVVNKQYFGKKIEENIVDFFTMNPTSNDLILHKQLCSKPVALYCHIDEKYLQYVSKFNSLQYCQRENSPVMKFNSYNKDDNVRCLCFIEDQESSTTEDELINRPYILIHGDNNPVWLFKSDTSVFSYTIRDHY